MLKLSIVLLTSCLVLTGCGEDDPAAPGSGNVSYHWRELDLGPQADGVLMIAVAFNGGHGMAMGMTSSFQPLLFRREAKASWQSFQWPDIPTSTAFYDLVLDSEGEAVLVGFRYGGTDSGGIVWDRRGGSPQLVHRGNSAMLTVTGQGSFLVAGGMSGGGELWTSTAAGVWNRDTLPLTGTNDSGFWDVSVLGDRAVACGYDDGADTLQVILQRSIGTDWTKVDLGNGRTFQHALHCIALNDSGSIFVGGSVGAGGLNPRAFLRVRGDAGDWTELVLPEPEEIGVVRDILIASDGSVYLACGGEGKDSLANLLRATEAGVRRELSSFPGALNRLAETVDGIVHAVGFRRNATDDSRTGVMLARMPEVMQ